MTLKYTYLLFYVWMVLLSMPSYANNGAIELITKTTQFEAGQSISLKFSNTDNETPSLYVSNSYGSTIIKPEIDSGILNYQIPQSISNKTGVVNWKLLANNSLSGAFTIISKQKAVALETYLGPPSIQAGGTDYSMLVVIPTDYLDNPLADSTKVTVKHQFLDNQNEEVVLMKNRIAYKNIYSETKTGRILVSSECLGFNSKEYTVNVLPAIPTDFNISHSRNHDYADGNQITTFSTSIIKDQFGNLVSDGTYIDFFITNRSNHILKTSSTTIKGIAVAKMIHPDHEDQWTVKAFVEGMAESKPIELAYKTIISDFNVLFSEDYRTVTIGPLKSFMNQMVPDGLEVSLSVFQNEIKLNTLTKSSFEGYATFKLDTNNFPSENYTLKIETAGVQKTYPNVKL
ncbi:hypothetical protein DIS18_12095 [Algibacter marinivivus]|uniref:Uncharacterized protein n=1 Tax=Algibacter marinivivus TaxID=2100723 RepID=A0A2U2X2J7_9FLAO|nr:hypothetical protein [Algibacter marinivivus]PWH82002.1 hypothetical protein DIS18_12095 [Algibacter marinivivus]